MKNKAEKKQQGDELRNQLATVSTVILSTFQGITVEQDSQLRRSVEAIGGKYQVVKNTVAEHAAAGTQAEPLLKNLKGTNSIAYIKTDPVALAKVLNKVAKDVPAFQFRAGLVEGRVISIQEIALLSEMPSKEELIGKLMFLINAPAQRLATALGALPRNLAVVVSEAVKAEKFGSGGAPVAAAPAPETAQ
jgi:large subunit ribosomal protein L10